MTTTKLFSLSILTLCVAACSGGGGGGGGGTNTTGTTSGSATTSAKTVPIKIENTGELYSITYAPISTNDNLHLTPTKSFVFERDIYKVKPLPASEQPKLNEMINYTNKLRAEKGLPRLRMDSTLMAAAQRRAEELVSYYHGSHGRPDGSKNGTIFNQKSGFGENISAGQKSVQLAMDSFKASSTHYPLMVNKNFTKTGVGFVYLPGSEYTYYWVQLFAIDGVNTNYYFDTSSSAQQNKLADVTTKADNINERIVWMIVDNFPIRLGEINPKGEWYSFSQTDNSGTTTYEGVLNGYSDVRFGLAQKRGEAHKVFYRGNNTAIDLEDPTKNSMPTSGTASYTGKGVITDGSNSRYLNSAFHADFANKNLNGVLSENGTKVTEINAIIRGVSFHSPSDATVETQGGFFGTNAKELGGVFYNHSTNEYGAFGATQ